MLILRPLLLFSPLRRIVPPSGDSNYVPPEIPASALVTEDSIPLATADGQYLIPES